MSFALSLALLAFAQSQPDDVIVWEMQTTDHDSFWIKSNEMRMDQGALTVWMHGEHSRNRSVPYRTSLWRIRFNCDGTLQTQASTTFNSEGQRIDSWDALGAIEYIRPDTIYQDIERKFCPARR